MRMIKCQITIIAIFLMIIASTVVSATPPTPTIRVNNQDIDWYQPITVSGSCYITIDPIKYFRVRAKFTDQVRDLGEWKVDPIGQNPATFSLTIPGSMMPRTGTIRITVKAIDEANRISLEPAVIYVTVHLPGGSPSSSDEAMDEHLTTPHLTPGFELLLVVCAIAMILFLKRKKG